MLDWIKKGLSCDDGSMDEARVSAMMVVLTIIGGSITLMVQGHFTLKDLGESIAAAGIGLGVWMGGRGKN